MHISCTQCGADVAVPADLSLLECPFCDTALIVEAGGTLFREVILPTVQPQDAVHHLRRFMAGSEAVAGLDRNAVIGEADLVFFPFWAFRIVKGGAERVMLEPAAPSSLQGLQGMALPAGETRSFKPELTGDAPVLEVEVPVTTAREWMQQRLGDVTEKRVVLYHLPMYHISYSYKGRSYRAAVDAVSGRVLPADFPTKAEAPFIAVAGLALVIFGLEGLVISNLLVKVFVYAFSAVPMLGLAWWISRKV